MPTALPSTRSGPNLTARQSARFVWLMMREHYLARRMERASRRFGSLGLDRDGGRLLHFTRRWLVCHAEIAELLRQPEPPKVQQVRATLVVRERSRALRM